MKVFDVGQLSYLESRKLKSLNPKHPLIVDLDRQSALFDEAASQFMASTA